MGESRYLSEHIFHFCILPRLPAKDLIRLQCVSRRWHSLISSDFYFIYLHSRSISSSLLYMECWKEKGVFLEDFVSIDPRSSGILNLPFPIKVNQRIVVASCDGLLCLLCLVGARTIFFIGNPILQDWRILLDIDLLKFSPDYYYGLAVDVEKSGMSYKFVAIKKFENDESMTKECVFYILSSRSGKWVVSKYKLELSKGCWPILGSSTYVNGVLYWLCPARILWFDTEDERSGFFTLPPDSDSFGNIGRWNGELIYIRVFKGKLEIWSAVDRSCWTIRHSICLKRMVQQNSEVFARPYDPYGGITSIYPMPDEGGNVVFFRIGTNMFSYDMETGVAEKKFDSGYMCSWFSYKSSLVPSLSLTSEDVF